MKLRIIWTGKTKKNYYREAIDDYAARIRKMADLEIVEAPEYRATDARRKTRVKKESASISARRKAGIAVILDSNGEQMTSEEFSGWLQGKNEVDFVLGGPAGLEPSQVFRLSFGKMTLPHELARVVLIEQVYRALTILRRIPYHK